MKFLLLAIASAVGLSGCIDWEQRVSVSRDGSTMVVSGGSDSGGLYVMAPDGTGFRRLDSEGKSPALSPDGKRCAYVVSGSATSAKGIDYVLMDPGTGQRWVLKSWPGVEGAASVWSPDGRSIAVVRLWSEDTRPATDLLLLDPESGAEERLAGAVSVSCGWSPDGRFLAFVGSTTGDVGPSPDLVDGDGETLSGLFVRSEAETRLAALLFAYRPLAWVGWLDEDRLAFVSTPVTLPMAASDEVREATISVYDARSESVTELAACGTAMTMGAVSSDGRRILFSEFMGGVSCCDVSSGAVREVTGKTTKGPPFWIGSNRFGWPSDTNVITIATIDDKGLWDDSQLVELDLEALAGAGGAR